MEQISLQKDLLSTKVAAEISGYSPDYLARLCKSKKIRGVQVGRAWLVERASLHEFLESQSDRNIVRARELARAREVEYQESLKAAMVAEERTVHQVQPKPHVSVLSKVPFSTSLVRAVGSFALAVLVVAGSAVFARADFLAATGARAIAAVTREADTARVALNTFVEGIGDNAHAAGERALAVRAALRESIASSTEGLAHDQLLAFSPEAVAAEESRLQLVTSQTQSSEDGTWHIASLVGERTATPTVAKQNIFASSVAFVRGVRAHPGATTFTLGRGLLGAYLALGDAGYHASVNAFVAYEHLINHVGESALALGVRTRDTQVAFPAALIRAEVAFGTAVIDTTHGVLALYNRGIYGYTEAAPVVAAQVGGAVYALGDTVGTQAGKLMPAILAGYTRSLYAWADAAPRVTDYVTSKQLALGEQILRVEGSVLALDAALTTRAGELTYAGARTVARAVDASPTLHGAKAAVENFALGALGKTAVALTPVTQKINRGVTVLSAAAAAAAAPLTLGEHVALSTYEAINNFFGATSDALAFIFSPLPRIVTPVINHNAHPLAVVTAPARTSTVYRTPATTIVQNIQNIQNVTQGVTGAQQVYVHDNLGALIDSLNSTIATNLTNALAPLQLALHFDGSLVTLPGSLVVDNSLTVHGSTTLSSLTISGSMSLATTTVTGAFSTTGDASIGGNLTVGNFSPGSISASGPVSAPYFIATSTVATSTFPNLVSTNLLATNASSTNTLAINSTTTNATSTNLFAENLVATNATTTNATSTNFFATLARATTGFFDTLNATLATITGLNVTNSTTTNATTTNAFVSNLIATNGSFDTLTATGSTSLASLTVNGATSFSGSINPNIGSNLLLATNASGVMVATSTPFAANYVATSTTLASVFPLASTTAVSASSALYAGTTHQSTLAGDYNASSIYGPLGVYGSSAAGTAGALIIQRGSMNGDTSLTFNDQGGSPMLSLYTKGNTAKDYLQSYQDYLVLGVLGNENALSIDAFGTIDVTSSLVPHANQTYDIGSPAKYWNNSYLNNLFVNNLSAASTSISGTNEQSFAIDAHNPTSDTQDISLVFYRGTAPSNAVLKWDSVAKRFDFNQNANFAGTTTSFVGTVGVGVSAMNAAAALQIDSTTQGFLPPRLTTAQKNAIASAPAGLTVFDSTVNKLNVYNGTAWKNVGATEINGEVTSGTPGSILFVGQGGVLSQDNANFNYATSTGTASVNKLVLGNALAVSSGGTGTTTFTANTIPYISSSGTLLFTSTSTLSIGGSAATATNVAVGGVTGLGTGVATALAVNTGSAGAFVINGGALGTPSSGTVTNLTGTASININGTVGATTPASGAFTTLNASGLSVFGRASSTLFSVSADGTATTTIASNATSTFAAGVSAVSLSIGNITGVLRATAGYVTAGLINLATDVTGILGIANGGTGLSAAPAAGELPVGNGTGGYALVSTTTLGIPIANLADAQISAPQTNQVLMWNGSKWVNAVSGSSFSFSVSSFTFDSSSGGSIEIGSGQWKASGKALAASYSNGPATSAYVTCAACSPAWSQLNFSSPFTSGTSATAVNFPASVNSSDTFTITANNGSGNQTRNATFTFLNNQYYGVTTNTSGYTSTDVVTNATGKVLTNSTSNAGFTVNAGAGQYILFSIRSALDAGSHCTFTVGGFSGGFGTPETDSITNASGFTENYHVYRSTNAGLGATTVVVSGCS